MELRLTSRRSFEASHRRPRERMLRPEAVAGAILFAAVAPPTVHHDEIEVMPPEGVL